MVTSGGSRPPGDSAIGVDGRQSAKASTKEASCDECQLFGLAIVDRDGVPTKQRGEPWVGRRQSNGVDTESQVIPAPYVRGFCKFVFLFF